MHDDFDQYFLDCIKNTLQQKIIRIHTSNGVLCNFVFVPSIIFGNRLISIAYLTEGGITGCSSDHQKEFLSKVYDVAYTYKVDYVELRGGIKPEGDQVIIRDKIYANFIKDFSDIPDVLLAIPRKKRADIRKAIDNPLLRFQQDITVQDFYRLFLASQHGHGTPTHSLGYFQHLVKNKNFTRIDGVFYQEKLVSVCLSFIKNNELVAYYGAADSDFVPYHVYDYLYYNLMCISKTLNKPFNFGRSKYDTGSFKYKTLWGFEPQETTHYVIPVSDKPIPDLRANNPEFSRKIAIWRKLPRWVVRWLGPVVLKQIG